MRRRVMTFVVAVGAFVMPVAGGAAGVSAAVGSPRITVQPELGTAHSHFQVSFRAPQLTGNFGAEGRHYILSASSSATGPGCVSNVSRRLPDTRAHAEARVTLSPRGPGSRWCAGTFNGVIEEIQSPVCAKAQVCPAFVVLLGTVGHFSFRVRPPGGDHTPPVFTGLQRAFACTPGAQRPGQTTPFTLSWTAATDDRTPSSNLVYDVYRSASQAGENFAHPTWTTSPGATTFRTPGLPSHGSFYFVVRARDQAGNEDRNRVERHGIDPCL